MPRGPPERLQLIPLLCHIDSDTNAGNWKQDKAEVFNANYKRLASEMLARSIMLIFVNGLPSTA
jgi:hypothetical protein